MPVSGTGHALPTDVRAGGAIILLFGLSTERLCHLTPEHLKSGDRHAHLVLGRHPVLLPNAGPDGGDGDEGRRRRLRLRHRIRLKVAKLGRSTGGLTSKIHLSADRRCRPLSFVLTPGQAADSPQFRTVLTRIKVRLPIGRPRTRPEAVAADKAYSSRANLHRRHIKAVIPEKSDQAAHRKKRGTRGGHPVNHDAEL